MCHYTQWKVGRDGRKREYPPVDGDRDLDNPDHWYWKLSWKQKNKSGRFVTHTKPVAKSKVQAVRSLIVGNVSIEEILRYLGVSD